jgi:hypothetical protein
VDSSYTIAAIAHKHGLNEKDTETLGDLVLTHLLVCSAGSYLEFKEDRFLSEEYLRKQLEEIEAKKAAKTK